VTPRSGKIPSSAVRPYWIGRSWIAAFSMEARLVEEWGIRENYTVATFLRRGELLKYAVGSEES
jgi:hypothetical protein